MEDQPKSVCGARNRQGKPCQKPPMKGRDRCMMHGGKTPAGQNSGKSNGNHRHGLYSTALTEVEKAAWPTIPTGDVDHEIRMCKIWLARALALDSAISQDPHSMSNKAGLQLTEIRQSSSGDNRSTDVITRRPDTIVRINMLLGRIAQLEKTRADLISSQAEHGDGDGMPLPWVD